jgi:hypothetical protein
MPNKIKMDSECTIIAVSSGSVAGALKSLVFVISPNHPAQGNISIFLEVHLGLENDPKIMTVIEFLMTQ